MIWLIAIFAVLKYANCLIEDCDHNYTLDVNKELIINSPGYPKHLYQNGSSCKYFVRTRLDYTIELYCYIDLDEVHSVRLLRDKISIKN